MQVARIAILGGGLGGLYAAALLEARGIDDYVLLEARDTFGGRIASVSRFPGVCSTDHPVHAAANPAYQAYRCDLGATWFWPALHPALSALIDTLGLETFEQPEAGDMLLEQTRQRPPVRMPGYLSAPPARRLAAGMGSLIDAVRGRLKSGRLITDCRVKDLQYHDSGIDVNTEDSLDNPQRYRVEQVLLAIPPRLAINTITFDPPLPESLAQQWNACATWMAPHAKYVAVFDRPFWREQGLSGAVRSSVGPMVEMHDASAPQGSAALFGFLGVSAEVRQRMPEGALLSACQDQLVRLFGEDAQAPVARFFKDWTRDPYTAVVADQTPAMHSFMTLAPAARSGVWRDKCIGIASEWSPAFPGYIAGAIDAAQRGVAMLVASATASSND